MTAKPVDDDVEQERVLALVTEAGRVLNAACELLDVLDRDIRADPSLADRSVECNRGRATELFTQLADVGRGIR